VAVVVDLGVCALRWIRDGSPSHLLFPGTSSVTPVVNRPPPLSEPLSEPSSTGRRGWVGMEEGTWVEGGRG
jgi:hypothetical protein